MRANEGSEFLAYFPEWAKLYTSVLQMYLYSIKWISKKKKKKSVELIELFHSYLNIFLIYFNFRYQELLRKTEEEWEKAAQLSTEVGRVYASHPYRDYIFARNKGN